MVESQQNWRKNNRSTHLAYQSFYDAKLRAGRAGETVQ
jgi:hypothetical protein